MPLLKCGCDRLKDISAHVRKRAINLIYVVLKYYHLVFVETADSSNYKINNLIFTLLYIIKIYI